MVVGNIVLNLDVSKLLVSFLTFARVPIFSHPSVAKLSSVVIISPSHLYFPQS